jgi:molybdate transport system regulatory protein
MLTARRRCYAAPIRRRDTLTMATKLTLRVDLGSGRALGPGKIRLLEAIEKTGSISQAGRKLGMSYRRAWLLVDDMNRCFREPVVTAQPGGSQGGGAALTVFGQKCHQYLAPSKRPPRPAAGPRHRGGAKATKAAALRLSWRAGCV